MENNFYVGNIYHKRRFRPSYIDSSVLYTEDNYNYLDLIKSKWYNTCTDEKEYVIKDSLIPTDIDDYRIDYKYMLNKYKVKKKVKSVKK